MKQPTKWEKRSSNHKLDKGLNKELLQSINTIKTAKGFEQSFVWSWVLVHASGNLSRNWDNEIIGLRLAGLESEILSKKKKKQQSLLEDLSSV